MSTYTVTLSDGRHFDSLTMNGNMFVSKSKITTDDLTAEALKTVTIASSDGSTETLHDAICDTVLDWPEGYLFNLREPSEMERSRALIEALTTELTNTQMALCDVYEMIGG